MSMLPEENAQGELNSDEQESLAIGEEMANDQETMLAGKYKNAEELEAAYIELQKKLGDSSDKEEDTPKEHLQELVNEGFVAKEGEDVSITPLGLNEKNRLCTLSGLNIMYSSEKKEDN